MLHTNTTQNSDCSSGSLQAVPSLFLNLPQEIHCKIGALLHPIALSKIIQTCRQCKQDYDTTLNFIPFLKSEYQKQIPKQLSKEMFAFKTRKKYNITFEHSSQFLKGESLQYLIMKNIVNKKDAPFFSEFELIDFCCRFQDPYICKLIESNLLSIKKTKNLTSNQVERLTKHNIYNMFTWNRLSLDDIEHLTTDQLEKLHKRCIYKLFMGRHLSLNEIKCLTNNQLERLCNARIYKLFQGGKLTLGDLECLTSNQIEKLNDNHIYMLFDRNKLSLKTIDSLTNDQFEKLRTYYVAMWIERSRLSLEDLENISVNQAKELNDTIYLLLINSLVSHSNVHTLTKNQIHRLCKPTISTLLMKKRLSLDEFKSLSDKQVERLSDYDIYWLFNKGILCLQDIETFSTDQIVTLSKRSFFSRMKTKAGCYWKSLRTNSKNQPS